MLIVKKKKKITKLKRLRLTEMNDKRTEPAAKSLKVAFRPKK